MTSDKRPRVFVSRIIPDEGLQPIVAQTDADVWQDDLPPPRDELLRRVEGVDGFLAMISTVLHAEDGAACEQIQAALRSPAFAVGPLALEHELPITRFHESVLARMDAR